MRFTTAEQWSAPTRRTPPSTAGDTTWRADSSAPLPATAVATANASHSTISSSTATPRTSRANRVCRIFRSAKILETTGTEVTATPTASTMISDRRLPFGPASDGRINHGTQQQCQEERQASADDRQPADLAALLAGEELTGFGARQKHEQQQSEPVDEIQDVCPAGCRPAADVAIAGSRPSSAGPEHDSRRGSRLQPSAAAA